MKLDDMKQYLLPLNIVQDDKRYSMNFYKKLQYLEELRKRIADDTHMDVSIGYGDMNSKICFIFNNQKLFNAMKQIVQEKLDLFEVNFWQIYVTFINKVDGDYARKYEVIASELSAIKPNLLYVFDSDKAAYDKVIAALAQFNIPVPERPFFVDVQELASDDEEVKRRLWHVLRYLINYKTLDNKK